MAGPCFRTEQATTQVLRHELAQVKLLALNCDYSSTLTSWPGFRSCRASLFGMTTHVLLLHAYFHQQTFCGSGNMGMTIVRTVTAESDPMLLVNPT